MGFFKTALDVGKRVTHLIKRWGWGVGGTQGVRVKVRGGGRVSTSGIFLLWTCRLVATTSSTESEGWGSHTVFEFMEFKFSIVI